VLILLSVLGFGWLWLRSTGASSIWLLLVVGSLDVLMVRTVGNVELILLFIVLLTAHLLWHHRPLLAAPLIALVVLVKPFYGLFFATLLAFQLIGRREVADQTLRSTVVAGLVATVLVALEVLRWDPKLRLETLHYLLHATDYLWLSLPLAEQSPQSEYTITPLQALVSAGVAVSIAQVLALGLWLLLAAATFWSTWGRRLSFPLAFALSLVLLYWGRPVGYNWTYFDFVVLLAAWPMLRHWHRNALLAILLSYGAFSWWSVVSYFLGLPSPGYWGKMPGWENWLVPLAAWLLLVWIARRAPNAAPDRREVSLEPVPA
jgi:hypothetical protein